MWRSGDYFPSGVENDDDDRSVEAGQSGARSKESYQGLVKGEPGENVVGKTTINHDFPRCSSVGAYVHVPVRGRMGSLNRFFGSASKNTRGIREERQNRNEKRNADDKGTKERRQRSRQEG